MWEHTQITSISEQPEILTPKSYRQHPAAPGGRQTRAALKSSQTEERKKWTLQAESQGILSRIKIAMASRIPNGLKGATSKERPSKASGEVL